MLARFVGLRLRQVQMGKSTSSSSVGQRALGAGLTLAVSVGLFAYGGLWLDARFGTKPWLLLLCVVCGIVGGILHLIRELAPGSWPFGRVPERAAARPAAAPLKSPPPKSPLPQIPPNTANDACPNQPPAEPNRTPPS